MTVSALQCFPMPDEVPLEDACSFFVNPFTAYAIVDTARSRGSPGLVLTAAASPRPDAGEAVQGGALPDRVRRAAEAQAETLRALGAEHVVVTAGGEAKELKEVIAQLGITVAFDAVAGPMTAAAARGAAQQVDGVRLWAAVGRAGAAAARPHLL